MSDTRFLILIRVALAIALVGFAAAMAIFDEQSFAVIGLGMAVYLVFQPVKGVDII